MSIDKLEKMCLCIFVALGLFVGVGVISMVVQEVVNPIQARRLIPYPVTHEYKLVDISFYEDVRTNMRGGITGRDTCIKYSFVLNNQVITKEYYYNDSMYKIYITEEEPKIVQINNNDNLDFYVSEEMLRNLHR